MYDKKVGYFESFDGTRIYYETRGKGPPLIFLYGIGASINHWHKQIRYFSSSFQTIVFDYRAHHKSDIPDNLSHLAIEDLAQDLLCLLRHLGIDEACYFGHSMGSQVLIAAYKLHPEAFDKLIFVNSFVADSAKNSIQIHLLKQFLHAISITQEKLPKALHLLWEKVFVNPFFIYTNPLFIHMSNFLGGFNLQLASYKDIEIYIRGVEILDTKSFLIIFENMLNYNDQSTLCRIQSPTMVIAGEKDNMTPLKYQREIYKTLPKGQWRLVPAGSHSTQLDVPDLVNLYSEEFLRKS